MKTTNTPNSINSSVTRFCKSITPTSKPEYVQLHPEPWCIKDNCYNNVAQKVKISGGKRQLGWRIQVAPDPLPKFMIEAVHHAIWISKTGKKIDITPQPLSADKIVFLSDDSIKLGMFKIGDKYQALIDCPLVKEYIQLCILESEQYVSKTLLTNQLNIPIELQQQQEKLVSEIVAKHGGK